MAPQKSKAFVQTRLRRPIIVVGIVFTVASKLLLSRIDPDPLPREGLGGAPTPSIYFPADASTPRTRALPLIPETPGPPPRPAQSPYNDSAGAGLSVFFEWPRPSDTFGLLTYRALESFLSYEPAPQFRVLVFAPLYAHHYKFANALSLQQFPK